MRGCDDGRVLLFWVADVVVATNSLVVIVDVCASVFTSIDEVAVSGAANRFNVVSSSLSLSVATSPPETKTTTNMSCNGDAGRDAERRPQTPSRHHGGQDQGCLIPGGNP